MAKRKCIRHHLRLSRHVARTETMCDPGDEVLIIEPFFAPYADQVKMAGATPVFVETDPDKGFIPSIESIREKVTVKTKALIVNTPNNPSGLCLEKETLEAIGELAEEKTFSSLLTIFTPPFPTPPPSCPCPPWSDLKRVPSPCVPSRKTSP